MHQFWSSEFLAVDDAVNTEIWDSSPTVQQEIQPASDAATKGVGAQQAMLIEGSVLPWVPDLVGRHWREGQSLLIVGSAYAPFVAGAAGRASTVSLLAYQRADSWQQFQRAFVEHVVREDHSYYRPLSVLAAATPAQTDCSALCVFDLCRVSFVQRDAAGAFRGGDAIVVGHAALFERYVEHSANQDWLWRRFRSTEASRIVALGTVAEHGLLRLFARRGCDLRVVGDSKRISSIANGLWTRRYACGDRKLSSWVERGDWWEIAAPEGGRVWRLLPVAHPSARGRRGVYERERQVLARML